MAIIDGLSMRIPVVIYDAPDHQIFRDSSLTRWMFGDESSICSYVMRLSQDDAFHVDEANAAHAIFYLTDPELQQVETALVGLLKAGK